MRIAKKSFFLPNNKIYCKIVQFSHCSKDSTEHVSVSGTKDSPEILRGMAFQ